MRTSVIRQGKIQGLIEKEKCKRREGMSYETQFRFFVFSWDKWVSEINEQSSRPKQIKHKSCSRTNASNMLTRLWDHEFQDDWQREVYHESEWRDVVFLGDYMSNTTKGHLCLISPSLCQFTHFSVTFHHSVCNCNVLCFLVYIHLLSILHSGNKPWKHTLFTKKINK